MAELSSLPEERKTNRRCFLGQRHLVTLIGFLSCFFISANKLILSVAIVAMVKHGQKSKTSKFNSSEISCPLPNSLEDSFVGSKFEGEFDWSTELQGYLLGIGFLSCLMTQVPAGRFADAFGSKSMLVYSNLLSGVLTIISPLAAIWHIYALMAAQFLRGALQGVTMPAVYKMMSNWIPRNERGTLNPLAVCGLSVGISVGGTITGWLCDIPELGWTSAFYICGAICVVISIAIHFVYFEHPENNPWIKGEELKFITDGLESKASEKRLPTPWKKMFTSVPTYAYFYGIFGHYWGVGYFLTVHPTFMATILHYTTAQSGLTSCLPVLLAAVGAVSASIISHWISKRNLISLSKLRTITTCGSAFGFSLCMVGILLAGCDVIINNLCFALSLFSLGIAHAGIMISGVDMAPSFAGSLVGVGTTLGGLGNFINPVITGLIVTHETLPEWQIVFWINLGVVGSSGLVYAFFGSAEVQPWNYPEGVHPNEAPHEERLHENKNINYVTNGKEKLELQKI